MSVEILRKSYREALAERLDEKTKWQLRVVETDSFKERLMGGTMMILSSTIVWGPAMAGSNIAGQLPSTGLTIAGVIAVSAFTWGFIGAGTGKN